MNKTEKEKLKKKWEATGLLDGLHLNNNINVNDCSTSYNTGGYLSTGTGTGINTGTLTINPGTGFITTTPALGTLAIDDGNYFTPQPGYSTFIDIPNENEFTIDVSKGLVKVYDFSKKVSTYLLKKFKSILIKEEEHNSVLIERELEPGELIQIKDYIDGDLILEFTEDLDDRYGEKYVYQSFNFNFNTVITNIAANTIAQDLITVQPLAAPTGQLFYMDYTYNNNLTINVNNTNDIATFGCNNTITTTNGTTSSSINTFA